jgi:hypothetical protein
VEPNWVGSWAAAQQIPEANNSLAPGDLRDATLRQVVHLSTSGEALRVRISNAFGTAPLVFTSAHIARPTAGGSPQIDASTDRALSFSGRPGVTIPAGAEYISDPIAFAVSAQSDLAITFHVDQPPEVETGHPGSPATSYLVHGDHVADADLPGAMTFEIIRKDSMRITHTTLRALRVLIWPASALACSLLFGQSRPAAVQSGPQPVTFTADQDQQNMQEQLGIKALRPGPSGNEKAPNHANCDESKANPFPGLPDPLTLKNGEKVTTPAAWWHERRPEIVEDFEREVYGRLPAKLPKVRWSVKAVDRERIGFNPVIAKEVIGHVDNSAYPLIDVNIRMTLVTLAETKGPVPVLMMFGRSGFPAPNQPSPSELERINAALKALLVQQDPSLREVFEQHPAYELETPPPFQMPQFNADGSPPPTWQIIADGWGFATIDPASIQADDGAGLTRGIIGLVNKGQPRKPDDWGALRAWAWGAGRGLDYLETDPAVDAKHVGIEGVSRFGKAALVTMAFDQRFATVLVGSSGKGGATLLRRNFGEAVENLTGGGYYWMAGNFMKYGASDAAFGSKNAEDLPVDSHELIALCAPRLTFISYGVPEKGDAKWLDHQGSFMAAVAASPVFTLLGAKGLGISEDYHTVKMPPVNVGLLDGQLAWRQHDGGHTDAPNMKYFLKWADGFIGHTRPPSE